MLTARLAAPRKAPANATRHVLPVIHSTPRPATTRAWVCLLLSCTAVLLGDNRVCTPQQNKAFWRVSVLSLLELFFIREGVFSCSFLSSSEIDQLVDFISYALHE